MSNVAVVFWSGTGNTEAMANEVLAGAKAAGATAQLFEADAFSADMASSFDALALGCPAMGDEELEDSVFGPLFEELKPVLAGRKVALFGSYGWGDGEWMRLWEKDCKDAGLTLACDYVICQEEPDDDAKAALQALGKALC